MKRFGFILACVSALMLMASCEKEVNAPATAGEYALVSVSVSPSVITRAEAGDGTQATDLYAVVYNQEGTELKDLRQHIASAVYPQSVEFKLVKEQTYKIVFLAQSTGAYLSGDAWDMKAITLPAGKLNSDEQDLFTAVKSVTVQEVNQSESVTLTRPFAQVNFACSDESLAAAIAAGFNPAKVKLSFKDLPETYNAVEGTVSGTRATVEYAEAEPYYHAFKAGYKTMAYAYLPVGADSYNTDATLVINDGARTISVTNLPIKANYRTNVLGDFFTSAVSYSVTIDGNFETQDFNISIEDQIALDGVIGQINAGTFTGTSVVLNPAVDGAVFDFSKLDEPLTQPVIVSGDKMANIQNLKASSTTSTPTISVEAGAKAIIEGCELSANASSNGRAININAGSNVTIKNSKLNGNYDKSYSRGINILGEGSTVSVEGSEIEGLYVFNLVSSAANNIVTVSDSKLYGWAIANFWNDGNTVTLKDCDMTSINKHSGTSNTFAAVVFNSKNNNTVNVDGGKILVTATGDQAQYLVGLSGKGNAVYAKGDLSIEGTHTNTDAPIAYFASGMTEEDWIVDIEESVTYSWSKE